MVVGWTKGQSVLVQDGQYLHRFFGKSEISCWVDVPLNVMLNVGWGLRER
jgi:hypothetical protein